MELVNLTVTSYLVFQGIAPSFWGPLSDVKGRRLTYFFCFVVFVAACIGLAESKNFATLIVLRCVQSAGSASTIAIGSGVMGDTTTRAERGGFMGIFQAGLLFPLAIGPVIGGALADSLGWRAIFWFLAIYSGAFLVFLVVCLPETLRSIVGNGSHLTSHFWVRFPLNVYHRTTARRHTHDCSPDELPPKKGIDLLSPFSICATRYVAPVLFFTALYYAVWQMCITAMSTLFQQHYHLTETQNGLTYLANGVGSMIGTTTTGKILDWEYRRVKAQLQSSPEEKSDSKNIEDFPIEKARFRLIPVFSVCQVLSVLLFGWSIQYAQVPIAVPIVATFILGWATVSVQSMVMTYLVDVFATKSAAASASLNLARCLLAAGGTSFIVPLIESIGVGPAFTICAGVETLAMVGPMLHWKYARGWRMSEREAQATESS